MRLIKITILFSFLAIHSIALGQNINQERLSVVFDGVTILEAIEQLDNMSKMDFAFDPSLFKSAKTVRVTLKDYTTTEILDYLLAETSIRYQLVDNQVILSKKIKKFQHVISGYIKDKETQEKLAYATIYLPDSEQGVTANEHGYFSMKVDQGQHKLVVGYVGRDEYEETLNVAKDIQVIFNLRNTQSLDEVLITPDAIQGSTGVQRNYQRAAIQEMALNTPAVSGESDVLQIVRSLPGIQSSAGEVGSFYVRGGDNDQNLVLMDGVPIYYPSHLLGIYSIFNAELVRDIQIFKGGFPARYGGRLSSVIDIHTKDGRTDGWHADVSGSYQSVRGAVQGPLFKGANIMLGGRKSLTSPFINNVIGGAFYRTSGDQLNSDYQDFNFKMSLKLGDKDRLVINGYSGNDIVSLGSTDIAEIDENDDNDVGFRQLSSNLNWNNTTFSINYQRELGINSFLKVAHTRNTFLNEYEELLIFDQFTESEEVGAYYYQNSFSDNNDSESKFQIDHYINSHVTNRYGAGFINHEFSASANNLTEVSNGEIDSLDLDIDNFNQLIDNTIGAQSYYAFVEHERNFSNKLFANFGLRWSGFSSDDEISFGNLEPRVNLKYITSERNTLHFSFTKMVQYVHQVSDSNLSFPKDLWLPSNSAILPAKSMQIGLGLNRIFANKINLDIQVYYKQLKDINFTFGITNFDGFTTSIEKIIRNGYGTNYGLEILAEIPHKKWFFSNSFSFARAERQYDKINQNLVFPFQYDRRIEWKALVNYSPNKKYSFGFRLLAGSGNPAYLVDPNQVSQFSYLNLTPFNPGLGNLNKERAQGHFRFDLSASYQRSSGKFNHTIKANLYNLFDINNYGFSYLNDSNNLNDRTQAFSIPFIPSVQYNLSF